MATSSTRCTLRVELIWLLVGCASLVRAQTGEAGHAIALDLVHGAVYVDGESFATVVKQVGDSEAWRNQLSNLPYDAVLALAVNPSGDIYAAGTRDKGGFLAKLGPDGTRLAMLSLNAPARALAVDNAGAVYLAGDGFIRKFDTQLQLVYSAKPSGQVTSIAVNPHGEAYAAVVGETSGVWKLSADGNWLYRSSVGPAAPSGIALDAVTSSVYVTGSTSSLDFPSTSGAQDRLSGVSDAFVAKIDDSGQMVWATYLGGSGADAGTAIALSSDGTLRVAGYTTSPDFPGSMTASRWNGYEDGFLAELDQAGNLIEGRYVGTPGRDRILAIAIDPGNAAVHVAGWSDQGMRALLRKRVETRPARSTSVRAASPLATPASAFTLGTNSIIVPAGADSNSVLLAGTGSWTTDTTASWLHLPVTSGTGGATVVFNFDANPDVTRVGTITFNDGALTLTVTQAGASYVAVNSLTTLVSSGLMYPKGVQVDGSGNIYINDAVTSAVYKWIASTQQLTTLIDSGLNGAENSALDSFGNLYIGDFLNNRVVKWTASTQQLTPLITTGFNLPSGVALDTAGNLYIADTFNNAIKEWNASTQVVTTLVASGLNVPKGLAVDILGNVYIADSKNNAVEKWSASTGQTTTLVSSGLRSDEGVAVDGGGNVYIADGSNKAIKKWSASTQQVTTLVSTGLVYPHAITLDGGGNIYIGDSVGAAVRKVVPGFIGPASIVEGAEAGTDSLLPVLPSGTPLSATSDQPWLTIGTIDNDVVNFSFTANLTTSARTAHITVLGQQLTVTQATNIPASINVSPGISPQSAAINTAFASPLTVTVKDSGDSPIQGMNVTFTAPATDASGLFSNNLSTITIATNSAGVASAPFTANGTAGENYAVTASVGALNATFTLTNLATAPASMNANPDATPQSAAINSAFGTALAVTAKDAGNNPLQGVYVTFTAPIAGASGHFSNNAATIVVATDNSGIASATFAANGTAGASYTVTATTAGLSANFTLTNLAGLPSSITATLGTTPQSAAINTPFASALAVTVRDASNNPLQGVDVIFTGPASGAGGHFSNSTATITVPTNSSGVAAASFTANGTGGANYTVTAAAGTLTTSFTLTNFVPMVQVTLQTIPAGLNYTVDATTYNTSQALNWVVGSSHTIATTSPQAGPTAKQYVFIGWSDNGALSHTITAPSTAVTYSGNFKTQYLLTTSVSPPNSGSVSGGGTFYDAGSNAPVRATPNADYGFIDWTGSVASGTNATTTVPMTAAQSVTANFALPAVNICGGAINNFLADAGFTGGHCDSFTQLVSLNGVTNPAPQAVYRTKRTGSSGVGFTYTLPPTGRPQLTAGQTYTVRLHFTDDVSTSAGQRRFNVLINNTLVLNNFDIFAAAGGTLKAVAPAFAATANAQGRIVIQWTYGSAGNPLANGIEIAPSSAGPPPAPTISGFSPPSGPIGSPVTITGQGFSLATGVTFNGISATFVPGSDSQITATVPPGATTGTITVKNAGGTGVSSASFTVTVPPPPSVFIDVGSTVAVGNFIADTYFNGGHTDNVSHTINASGVTGAAPAQVYQTKRTGNNNGPFSYVIPGLPPSQTYAVKMHFGDDVSTAAGQRKFSVLINGAAVLSNFDIFAAAGAANKAVVRQVAASADAQGRITINLTPTVGNPLLNGIELIPQ